MALSAAEARLDGAGEFVAFLSTQGVDAKSRIQDAAYINANLAVVADGLADLLDGSVARAVRYDESGDRVPSNLATWTGSSPGGTFDGNHTDCDGWTASGADVATVGNCGSTGENWADNGDRTCEQNSTRIYCFEVDPTLLFSEYGEGTSWNKWLEIYNATDETITLDGYAIGKCTNACADWETLIPFTEDVDLAPGSTWVVAHSDADAELLALVDQTSDTLTHNGNDALGLLDPDGNLIDVIGDFDVPDFGWAVGGVVEGTKNHTLKRDCSITHGNADWALSSGDANSSEWAVLDQNDISDVGQHAICE